jgi:O-antigen/teichoic acid export membrane protein
METIRVVAARIGGLATGPRFWTLVDQGIVSLGSALTIVLLARNLAPDHFGVAVLLIAVMLFLNAVHASLVVYPLSVYGAPLDGVGFRRYTSQSLLSTLIIALPLGVGMSVIAVAFGSASAAVWSGVGLIAWQVQETTRRALFARLRHRDAIPGDILSYAGQAVMIGVLGSTGRLSLPLVFVSLTVTSLVGAVFQLAQLRPAGFDPRGALSWSSSGLRHGRWTLPSNMLGALIMQAPLWTIALFEARSTAGQFQALVALVGVMNPIMYGVANLLTPAVAQASEERSAPLSERLVATSLSQGALLLLPYAVILWLWPSQILGLIYGHELTAGLALPLRLLTFAYLLVYLAHVGNAALFGLKRPQAVLSVQMAGALLLIIAGIPAVAVWGIVGAAATAILAHGARSIVCARELGRALELSGRRDVIAVEGS